MDIFDKATRSRIMAQIRSKNTRPELLLRKILRKAGLSFSIHANLPGTPDIVFKRHKIAVFVDGEFWHGYNWVKKGIKPSTPFWKRKLLRNIARDKRVNRELRKSGWKVVRIWERQLLRPNYAVGRIKRALAH